MMFFFFSSRRRHTRFDCDWSSDGALPISTWIAQELSLLFDRYLGPEWVDRHDDIAFWNRVMEIPDEELWNVKVFLKRKFLAFARERARARWTEDRVDPRQVIAMGTLLDPDALTIGFARRFT